MRTSRERARGAIILAIFSIIFLIVFAIIAPRAKANIDIFSNDLGIKWDNDYTVVQTFNLQKEYGYKYNDVNKPVEYGRIKHGFEKTCVHAAIATAITYSIGGSRSDSEELYLRLVNDLGNKPARPSDVWEKIMSYSPKTLNGYNRYYGFDLTIGNSGRSWNELMHGMLYSGWVVLPILKFEDSKLKHIITLYGYTLFSDGDARYTYVDSDDNYYGWRKLTAIDKGKKTFIYFEDEKQKITHIGEVVGLVCIKVVK